MSNVKVFKHLIIRHFVGNWKLGELEIWERITNETKY